MTIYKGFSTQFSCTRPNTNFMNLPTGTPNPSSSTVNPNSSFSVTDDRLVILDFLNALNIPQGQLPGRPAYGTTLWNFVFEPNTPDVVAQVKQEVARVANLDSRLILGSIDVVSNENDINLLMEVAIAPMNNVYDLTVLVSSTTNKVVLV